MGWASQFSKHQVPWQLKSVIFELQRLIGSTTPQLPRLWNSWSCSLHISYQSHTNLLWWWKESALPGRWTRMSFDWHVALALATCTNMRSIPQVQAFLAYLLITCQSHPPLVPCTLCLRPDGLPLALPRRMSWKDSWRQWLNDLVGLQNWFCHTIPRIWYTCYASTFGNYRT